MNAEDTTQQATLRQPGMLRRLAYWFEPTLGELESDYRRHFFQEDLGQAVFIISLVIVSVIVLGIVDFQLAAAPDTLAALLGSRLIFIALAAACLFLIKHIRQPVLLDRVMLALGLLLVGVSLVINALRPAFYYQNLIIHVLIVVGCYVVMPGPLANRLLPSALLTLGSLASIAWMKTGIQLPALTTVTATFIITHILGYLSASRLSASRRNQYKIWLETEAARDRLEILAATDSLTQLLNRRQFISLAEQAFARFKRSGIPFSLILADLDHFKEINDSFGHQAGDRALVVFSDMLADSLRSYDIAGRMGGEEFSLLLPGARLAEAGYVAERLRERCLALSIPTNHDEHTLTVSMGVAEVAARDEHLDDLILRADAALYQAKAAGRNAVNIAALQ